MLTATPWPRRRRPANPVEPRRPRVARVCDAANREQLFVAGYAASYSNATRRRLRGRDRASPRYDPYRHNCDRRGVWLNSAGASRRSARNAARNAATPAQYTTGERVASPAVRSTALDASNVNTAMACAASRRRRCATRLTSAGSSIRRWRSISSIWRFTCSSSTGHLRLLVESPSPIQLRVETAR